MYGLMGLFLELGGWPRGRQTTSIKAPSASCLGFRANVGPPSLLRLSLSSKCCVVDDDGDDDVGFGSWWGLGGKGEKMGFGDVEMMM